jgi:EmrB/QacA subfamily drug resistance transporter
MVQKNNQKWVVAGLLLGILMAAMDNTIVATAMGTIVSELGDLDKFIWVTSAYMIASVAGMPIFGKLSDMYGRKLFYIGGISLFILGSVLCGTAQNMTELSIYRAIQGLGGGALMPIAFTIIFDIFPPEKRGKMTGLFGAVFGISSVFGPLMGAYLTDFLSWQWIFYVNIPIGLLSLLLVHKKYTESLEFKKQRVDWIGAILLVFSVVSLMFALELGGKEFPWNSSVIIGLLAAFLIMFSMFLWVETKVEEPIVNFSLFKKRLFAASQGVSFFYGTVFIVATMLIPIYIQGVYGGSATEAGMLLIPMMLGSVVGSQFGGQLVNRTSYRNLMIVSGILFFSGIFLLGQLTVETPSSLLVVYMVITGMGVGISFPILSMASLHGLDIRQRGIANSANAFFRMIGMALGITIYGTIQNRILLTQVKEILPDSEMYNKFGDTKALLQPEVREQIPSEILENMTSAFSQSISTVFQFALISLGISLVFILAMSKDKITDTITKKEEIV